jgi:hypothetical protein
MSLRDEVGMWCQDPRILRCARLSPGSMLTESPDLDESAR